jgi:hypothetical protein
LRGTLPLDDSVGVSSPDIDTRSEVSDVVGDDAAGLDATVRESLDDASDSKQHGGDLLSVVLGLGGLGTGDGETGLGGDAQSRAERDTLERKEGRRRHILGVVYGRSACPIEHEDEGAGGLWSASAWTLGMLVRRTRSMMRSCGRRDDNAVRDGEVGAEEVDARGLSDA